MLEHAHATDQTDGCPSATHDETEFERELQLAGREVLRARAAERRADRSDRLHQELVFLGRLRMAGEIAGVDSAFEHAKARWQEHFGTKLTWSRYHYLRYSPKTLKARALALQDVLDDGFAILLASNANIHAATVIAWAQAEIEYLQQPEVCARFTEVTGSACHHVNGTDVVTPYTRPPVALLVALIRLIGDIVKAQLAASAPRARIP